MQKFLYNIIPALKFPQGKNQLYSYTSTTKLNPGQIVEIFFCGKKIQGLTYSQNHQSLDKIGFKLKNVIKISPIILPYQQIKLANWLSRYYYTSISHFIKLMIPKLIKQRTKKVSSNLSNQKSHTNFTNPTNFTNFTNYKKFPKLTQQQQIIFEQISKSKNFKVFLIQGVTSSGKTEIYLRLVNEQIKQNKQSIILVPEISLTPQTINRFQQHFDQQMIAVLNSKLSAGEKYTEWQKIYNQKAKIIIGPRSTVFAPVQKLGLIIIDEEHDSSFKQYDQNPRYHAKTVALKLGQLHNAKVVLGSATPDIQSKYLAEHKIYTLLKLKDRYTANSIMPKVEIVDMREEFKKKNFSIFSENLLKELDIIIKNNRQALLYINRRGVATFVNCRDCGYIAKCKNCDVPLTFHLYYQNNLRCHYCNYTTQTPIVCPKCKSFAIKYFGTGTEKVEQELQKMYKYVKIFRMDSDTTRSKHSHAQIYNDFRLRKANILIGTQMITKGWDLPAIDLIGVVSSDVGLNLPDFRTQEKTFQLLTQIAGRTGRGKNPGKVIFQTYQPDNFIIKTAAKHDYESFYNQEIKTRKTLNYPPFVQLIKLIYKNSDPKKAQQEAIELHHKLMNFNFKLTTILGPSPSFFSKIQGRYIWQIIIKLKDQKLKNNILKQIPNDWIINIDPESLL